MRGLHSQWARSDWHACSHFNFLQYRWLYMNVLCKCCSIKLNYFRGYTRVLNLVFVPFEPWRCSKCLCKFLGASFFVDLLFPFTVDRPIFWWIVSRTISFPVVFPLSCGAAGKISGDIEFLDLIMISGWICACSSFITLNVINAGAKWSNK